MTLQPVNVGTDVKKQVFPGKGLTVMESAALLGLSGRSCSYVCLSPNLLFGIQSEQGPWLAETAALAPEATPAREHLVFSLSTPSSLSHAPLASFLLNPLLFLSPFLCCNGRQ